MADEVLFFATPTDFQAWLVKNHDTVDEQWVGFYKVCSGKPSITWQESVDEALCFGWIDGLRKRIDDEAYRIRFTPRRPKSKWSTKNIASVEKLISEGRMRPSGLRAYEKRGEDGSRTYSYEQRNQAEFPPDYEDELRRNEAAWAFFQQQAPWYRRTATYWVISARRKDTRRRRLETLITDSAAGRTIGPLRRSSQGAGSHRSD